MAVIKLKPTSPGTRFQVRISKSHLYKGGPHEPLTVAQSYDAPSDTLTVAVSYPPDPCAPAAPCRTPPFPYRKLSHFLPRPPTKARTLLQC